MKLSELESTNQKGVTVSTEFYEENGSIHMRIKRGGRVTSDIYYTVGQFEQLVGKAARAGREVDGGRGDGFAPVSDDMSPESKLELISDIADTIDEGEIERVSRSTDEVISDRSKLMRVLGMGYTPREYVDKTKEQVMQLIYEKRGFDWFISPEFSKWHEEEYGEGNARMPLHRLFKKDYLDRDEVEDDEFDNNMITYKYRLNDKARSMLVPGEGFLSDKNPAWVRKKTLLPYDC